MDARKTDPPTSDPAPTCRSLADTLTKLHDALNQIESIDTCLLDCDDWLSSRTTSLVNDRAVATATVVSCLSEFQRHGVTPEMSHLCRIFVTLDRLNDLLRLASVVHQQTVQEIRQLSGQELLLSALAPDRAAAPHLDCLG